MTNIPLPYQQIINEYQTRPGAVDVEGLAKELSIEVKEDFMGRQSGKICIEGDKFVVYVNIIHPSARQRFTIAHEIGHFIYDRKEIEERKGLKDSAMWRSELSTMEEVRANRFAADLLMPDSKIDEILKAHKGKITVNTLAEELNVSLRALELKLGIFD